MRLASTHRRGMTLIELLVVIGLILVLITLAVTISPRVAEDQRSARAADHVSGWLLAAKQRAYRDQQARGIRLVRSVDNPNEVKELVYIERPEDYRGGMLHCPAPPVVRNFAPAVPAAFNANATVFIAGKDLTNNAGGAPVNSPIVEPGDFLVFDVLEPIPYNSHRIWQVTYFPGDAATNTPMGTRLMLATVDGSRASVVNSGFPVGAAPPGPGLQMDRFRFVRKPRPLVGETAMQLPRDMIIDLGLTTQQGGSVFPSIVALPRPYPFPPTVPEEYLDILFSPRGQIIGPNSTGGKIILRIRNRDRDILEGDQILVTIYTRSGFIASHPLDLTDNNADGILDDPYRFTKDGNTSGF